MADKSKKIFHSTIWVFLLLLCISMGGTLAYLTSARFLDSDISVGSNEIAISENYFPPSELKLGANEYKKTIAVANTGSVPCYVRLFVDFSDGRSKELSEISADGGASWMPAKDMAAHLPNGWVWGGTDAQLGGYYYYTEPVAPASATAPIITNIRTTYTDPADISQYQIIVYSESVQALDKDGLPVDYAAAWDRFLARK